MKKIVFVLIVLSGILNAEIPPGYYDDAYGLTGDELKAALHEIINDHTEFPYNSENTDVWDILKVTDADPNAPDSVILIYTGWKANGELEYNNGQGWSREHVWAKSHGDFGITMGAGTDVHHIRPCDITVNSARGNKDFDDGGTEYIDGDGPTGCYSTTYTWEPREAVKGDVARMIFYMAVRYEGEGDEPDLEMVDYVPSAPNLEPFHGKFSTLMEWHSIDPVDEWEENRNDIIYIDYQGNRNPFIDHPEFADLIWGNVSYENDVEKVNCKLYSYPNPFNPSGAGCSLETTIVFSLEKSCYVDLTIFNVKGEKVATLLGNEYKPEGDNFYFWNGLDDAGKKVATGTYFIEMKVDGKIFKRKMTLVK